MSSLVLYVIQITFQPVGKITSYELILAEISSIANLPPPLFWPCSSMGSGVQLVAWGTI